MLRNYTNLFRRVLTSVIMQHKFEEHGKILTGVICDDTNNTDAVKAAGELVIKVMFTRLESGYHKVTFYHNFLDEVEYATSRRAQVIELIGLDAVRLIEGYEYKNYLDTADVKTAPKSKSIIPITFGRDGKGNITHIQGAPFDGNRYLLKGVTGWVEGNWVERTINPDAIDGEEGFYWELQDDEYTLDYNDVTHYTALPDDVQSEPERQGFLSGIRSAASLLFYKACNTWKPLSHPLYSACLNESKLLDEAAESILELEPVEYAKWKDINKLSAELASAYEEVSRLRKWRDSIVSVSHQIDSDFFEDDPERTVKDLVNTGARTGEHI